MWTHLQSISLLTRYPRKQVDFSVSNLRSLAEEYLRFVMHFFHPIQQSAPHIYHSALPLSPSSPLLRLTFPREKTLIARFYGRPDDWGPVIRTIKGAVGRFKCMTTIGHRIAAACNDGTVTIYDSVTGVLRLSLSPEYPVEAVTGSPDSSMIFCTHRQDPSITLWDIQTGGLIHTFMLKSQVNDTAISLEGRYLACGLSDGSVHFWEVAKRKECPAFGDGFPVTHLCWLAPEEQLVVVNLASLRILDVVTGTALYTLRMPDPVCGTAYSQKLNQLAVATSSGGESIITTIDPRTGVSSTSSRIQRRLSCLTFSQTTKELVCGMRTNGLQLFNITAKRWKQFDHPATIMSVSTLSNGTVVADAAGSSIQLLSLDGGYAPSRQLIAPALRVYTFNDNRIIAIVPLIQTCVMLLESTAMLPLLTIPGQGDGLSVLRAVVLCASLESFTAVRCFAEDGKENMQLWRFGNGSPEWTVEVDGQPSIGRISPARTRLVTFHTAHYQVYVCVRDVGDGRLLEKLLLHDRPALPLDITFDSEDRFYSHHPTYRVPYVLVSPSGSDAPNHSITCGRRFDIAFQLPSRRFSLDDSREWVVSGSQRICWIPPGYIGPAQASYCWAGSSLVMAGQDGTLRKLTFQEPRG